MIGSANPMNADRAGAGTGFARFARRMLSFGGVAGPILLLVTLACGCASPNVNPPKPKPGLGYVDFFAPAQHELAWQVERWDSEKQRHQALFSHFEPLAEPILRLALPAGRHQLKVTVLNRVTFDAEPLDLDVLDGQVIPVRVTLVAAGKTAVRDRRESAGGTPFGRYGRRTKIVYDEETIFRISASAEPAQPYQTKQDMPYATAATAVPEPAP